jgi:hypothetical protein
MPFPQGCRAFLAAFNFKVAGPFLFWQFVENGVFLLYEKN